MRPTHRFLFRQKLTHQRMKNFLSVMMKIKKAKNLDNRLEALIDNAFYTCCPPERCGQLSSLRARPSSRTLVFSFFAFDTWGTDSRKSNFILVFFSFSFLFTLRWSVFEFEKLCAKKNVTCVRHRLLQLLH